MRNMTKKHVLALTAAGAVIAGATSLPAASPASARGVKSTDAAAAMPMRHRTHRVAHRSTIRTQNGLAAGAQNADNWNAQSLNQPRSAGWPAATAANLGSEAAIGGGTVSGPVIGGTAAAVTGYPYGTYGYPYANGAYARYPYGGYGAYRSYAYAPEYAASAGFARDIGHSAYNRIGAPEPASQDNCAIDGGYGRKDYSQC